MGLSFGLMVKKMKGVTLVTKQSENDTDVEEEEGNAEVGTGRLRARDLLVVRTKESWYCRGGGCKKKNGGTHHKGFKGKVEKLRRTTYLTGINRVGVC